MHNLLHLVPTEVQIALNEITVNEAANRLGLLIGVKWPPANATVNENFHSLSQSHNSLSKYRV